MFRSLMYAALCLSFVASTAAADVELPAVFGDHMVVQRDQPVKVWGWAGAGESVRATLAESSATATANADGKWSLQLGPMAAGGPHTLSVQAGDDELSISDVYIGEVWLCSGQSNMAMTVGRAQNAKEEQANADLPLIRMFKETSPHAKTPQERGRGSWAVCSPETVGAFSATAYFFGRRLHKHLNVPIGLINSSSGGTAIESWTSLPTQRANTDVAPILADWRKQNNAFDPAVAKADYETALQRWNERRKRAQAAGTRVPRRPTMAAPPEDDKNYPANLFNGKIQPLVGYAIRGAIWYQGERNSRTELSRLYGDQLATLIRDWRQRWAQGDFPFAWVQLPNYQARQTEPSEPSGWVNVREGMLKSLKIPATGMAITVDVGEANDIHPKNKQAVGARLARWALCEVYGRSTELPDGLDPIGPIYESAQRVGDRMRINFQYAGDELRQPDGELTGFAMAGPDRQFHWAQARVVANYVEVWSDEVPDPQAVRYSWAANPLGNLFNGTGLPASPFRTDDWDE